MAKKTTGPQIVSANHLIDGGAIWLGPAGWVRDPRAASVAHDAEAAAALLARAEADHGRVVGPYLLGATLGPDGPFPTHHREAMRARGPSFRADLGPQPEL